MFEISLNKSQFGQEKQEGTKKTEEAKHAVNDGQEFQLQLLPQELQAKIIELMDEKDILFLGIANKYFYEFLSPIRILFTDRKVSGKWPCLKFACCNQQDVLKYIALFEKVPYKIQKIKINARKYMEFKGIHLRRIAHQLMIYDGFGVFSDIIGDEEFCKLDILCIYSSISELQNCQLRNKNITRKLRISDNDINCKLLAQAIIDYQIHELLLLDIKYLENSSIDDLISILHKTKLKKLYISDELTDDIITSLARSLPNSSITQLEFAGTISEIGAKAIAQMLPNTKLRRLVLTCSHIPFEGYKSLFQALPKSKLECFDFDGNIDPELWYLLYEQSLFIRVNNITRFAIFNQKALDAVTNILERHYFTEIEVNEMEEELIEPFFQAVAKSKLKKLKIAELTFKSCQILAEYLPKLPVKSFYGHTRVLKSTDWELFYNQVEKLNLKINHTGPKGFRGENGYEFKISQYKI
ncbi:hypothetical protein HK103_006071 [Boothiomyces macroporosus]|uniref:F-box domain-containing protein n=1 Tax=Boothiomyces macroporosus TaxID=261099 RepID=A0AAD5UI57_9FUNG|nr:hypothetical protein HK103_006071 [Boothiomyces macroporosus]